MFDLKVPLVRAEFLSRSERKLSMSRSVSGSCSCLSSPFSCTRILFIVLSCDGNPKVRSSGLLQIISNSVRIVEYASFYS